MNEKENNDVRIFMESMERQLELNEFKDGWIGCDVSYLLEQFRKKICTVNHLCDISIIKLLNEYDNSKLAIQTLQLFLADLANYAMMISSNMGRTVK